MKSIQFSRNWNKEKKFLVLSLSSSPVTKGKFVNMHLVIPYFNFLIFSFVLWNSCFPMRREKVFERNNMVFPEISISMYNHLKLASHANSKHIFTGQKNSALVSLQFSKLATGTKELNREVIIHGGNPMYTSGFHIKIFTQGEN